MKNTYCEICDSSEWGIVYSGRIRDGVYSKFCNDASVYQCKKCGVQRLLESDCIPEEYYETGEYRDKLSQNLVLDSAIKEHELLNKFTFESIWPLTIRNKSILDVGCGTGSLLDTFKGVSKLQVGIEPCEPYLLNMIEKGHEVYKSTSMLANEYGPESFDMAFSIQVIEHVLNPKLFLKDIFPLLQPGADLIISTPNRNDILMSILPKEFPSFFYRTQHRWYFDKKSLEFCATSAGYEVIETKHIHRYGMSNMLYWLRDLQPKGMKKMEGINRLADGLWKSYLENTCQSDNIYIYI